MRDLTYISPEAVLSREGYGSLQRFLAEYATEAVVPACCNHGCMVEPDGECEHGNKSVLLELGII